MGNSKSKKVVKEPSSFFERQKYQQYEREKATREMASQAAKRERAQSHPTPGAVPPPNPRPVDYQPVIVSFDQESIDRMRHQLRHDANAFLLNNIMLSVHFFNNYERIVWDLKNNTSAESDGELNVKMAQHQKHVFLPDKLQEAVHSHVQFKAKIKGEAPEDIVSQRLFVVHDNVEVSEPGDVSDYSTVLDAPYYKMLLEPSEEPGYVMLRKMEILGNKSSLEDMRKSASFSKSSDCSGSDMSDSSDESENEIDIRPSTSRENITEGENFMNELKQQIEKTPKSAFKVPEILREVDEKKYNKNTFGPKDEKENNVVNGKTSNSDITIERRPSGILKQSNQAVTKGQLANTQNNDNKKPKKRSEDKPVDKVSPNGSESSGYKSSYSPHDSIGNESDYGYATITAETTPRKLEISQSAKFSDNSSVIPLRCITMITVKKPINGESDDEDDLDEAYNARYGPDFQRDLYKNMYYLNSKLFMENFSDIFLLKLSEPLGFSVRALNQAMTQGASIYCNMERGQQNISFEVIPAVNTNWPSAAAGWLNRPRNIINNPRTNVKYKWPTPYMLNKARGLGCTVIPIGFRPTRGINPKQGMQWKLTFPQVERYLESCLAHSQVRCYIFTQLLFKTFIKTENTKLGLDFYHIRNHLFWQCEDNYAKWPEDRLGESLRLFLRSFYQHLMKNKMPDYFIPQCNILKGIPRTVLLKQQRKLADIIESPVMHLLTSLRNLKNMKSDFYPVLNYQKLYRILTTNDILKLVNPHLPQLDDMNEEDSDDEYKKDKGFWEDIKNKDPGYQWKKQQRRQIEAKKVAESLIQNKKNTKDLIDRKIILPSNLETNRKRLVLELFIPHFIAMADCSDKFEATRQAIIYLEHAQRLAIVLKDEPASEAQAREYIAIIKEKLDSVKIKVAKSGAPKVPKRNESFKLNMPKNNPNVPHSEKPNQYANIIINNNNTNIIEEPTSPTVKLANVVLVDVHVDSDKPKFQRSVSFQKVEEETEEMNNSSDDDDITVSKL